jgi:FMN-dependent NADH-azoreductase
MKVLVINASANKERSTTLKLTKSFLEGLGVEASDVEFVTTIGLNVRHRHILIHRCSQPKHSSRP